MLTIGISPSDLKEGGGGEGYPSAIRLVECVERIVCQATKMSCKLGRQSWNQLAQSILAKNVFFFFLKHYGRRYDIKIMREVRVHIKIMREVREILRGIELDQQVILKKEVVCLKNGWKYLLEHMNAINQILDQICDDILI